MFISDKLRSAENKNLMLEPPAKNNSFIYFVHIHVRVYAIKLTTVQ